MSATTDSVIDGASMV